jgi:serine protease AprX
MKKERCSRSGFSFPRVLLGFGLCSAGMFLVLISLGLPFGSSALAENTAPAVKIASWVLEQTANGASAEFLVVLADQADLSGADGFRAKEEKGRYVRDVLWSKAQATQGPLLTWLRDHRIEHRAYYIVNMIWVKANRDIALQLAARSDVLRLDGNPAIQNFDPLPEEEATELPPNDPTAIEPGITHTRAPEVWAAGFTGQGIVVAGADTGYRWTHNALKAHYRGWNGAVANHNYNWHDSIHTSTGVCGQDSVQPCDDHGHGTHTMGTATGDDGATNQIGMAPGAKWIGCRNMNGGAGTPATYIECMEFFLAPYPVGGTPAQGDSTKAPDVTNNSWGCPPSEGCNVTSLQAAVEAQRAAGIVMVVSAGNSGPACSTISDPPGFYDAVYSVGALNTGADTIASFSSRGPVTADGSMRLKPDISAPGTGTRSATRGSDSAYQSLSGTSMASPHVAGAVALLLSARPLLRGDVMATRNLLNTAAVHLNSNTCDAGNPPASPNNTFGYGRLDVKTAVDSGPGPSPTPTPSASPTPTATVTPSPAPTATPSPTASPSPSVSPSPSPSVSPSPSASPTPPFYTPTPTPPSLLGNIATRLRVENGDNVLIGGFIVTGGGSKSVVIRAVGPSLGLPGQLANPTLELRNSAGALLDQNDDWQTSVNKQAIIDSGLAPSNDLESAIIQTLPAGGAAYTALVRGANNTTGIGVVQIYDVDSAIGARLVNISSRGLVQTGDNVLIAGMIVVGQASQKVVVRAIGPSLPLAGKLADPSLELHDANGAMLEANDDWVLSNNKQAIVDSGLAPTNDAESAIIRTLPPANYTAVVFGSGGTTGIAVVEVYAVN